MSKSAGRPPALCNASLVKLVHHLYDFLHIDVNSVQSLPSYNDRNYYFRGIQTSVHRPRPINSTEVSLPNVDEKQQLTGGDSGSVEIREFVLKIFNSLHTTVNTVRGISAIWSHLQSKGFNYTKQLVNRQGSLIASLTVQELSKFEDEVSKSVEFENGDLSCAVRVMRYIPGELFDKVDKKYLTPRLMYDVGALIGKVDAVLQDDFHSVDVDKRMNSDWDLTHLLSLGQHLSSLDDPKKRCMAERILGYFNSIMPKLSSFTRGVLHGDPNGMNIILKKNSSKDEYEIAGLIDFDDTVKSYSVFDLSILLTYLMIENLNPIGYASPVEFVGPTVSGYMHRFPLTPEEVSSLYYLVLGRCCQSVLLGEVCYKAEPWNDYLLITPKKCWKLIELLLSMNKDDVDKIWSDALRN